jgi:pantoate kinase
MTEATTQAFVPGHVTGFFAVHRESTPAKSGSRGAGLALSDGVTVSVTPTPAADSAILFDGDSVDMAAPERVLDAFGDSARVAIETDLPLATGFGVSGAAALGTALAANGAFERANTENELIGLAHAAEVEAGTGLGDVVAQARGGVPIRLEPGGPSAGLLDGLAVTGRVEYLSFGAVSTASVLGEDTETLSAAGERALSTLRETPTIERFMHASRTFAREADLLTPQVESVLADVAAAGGEAAMAMLGETVVAIDTGLSDAGYEPAVCSIHPPGATLID